MSLLPDRSRSPLRFLTYNIVDGGRGREQALREIIAAQTADVILLQEVARPDFVRALTEQLGHACFVAASNSHLTLALLTRLPIISASDLHPRVLRHTCLRATLEHAPGESLTVFGVHLGAPTFALPVELYRLRELNLILNHVRQSGGQQVVIGGDFNSIAPGDHPDFSGLPFKPRVSIFLHGGAVARQVIGMMRSRGFTDAFRALNPNRDGFTLPAFDPKTRLDYFFVNAALRPFLRHCAVVTSPVSVLTASDHLPVYLELAL